MIAATARSRASLKIVVSAASLLLAIWYTWQASALPMGSIDRPGPGLFPIITGAFFILMCCVAIVEAQIEKFKAERSQPAPATAIPATLAASQATATANYAPVAASPVGSDGPTLPDEAENGTGSAEPTVNTRKLVGFLAIITAHIALFVPLGFFVSTVLSLAGISTLLSGLGRKNIIRNAIFAVALTFVLYFIFVMVLDIRLPVGVYAPTVE